MDHDSTEAACGGAELDRNPGATSGERPRRIEIHETSGMGDRDRIVIQTEALLREFSGS